MSKFKKAVFDESVYDFKPGMRKLSRKIMFWTLGLGAVLIAIRILSLVIFKEPRFDKYVCTIVRNHLWWDIAIFVLLGTLTVIFAVQIFSSIKNGKKKKKSKKKLKPLWEYWEYILWTAFVVLLVFQARDIVNVFLDIKNESYTVYNGEFVQINDNHRFTQYQNTCTTRLEPEDIRLRSTGYLIDDGTYVGTVIYTERSEIVVEIKDVVPKK